MPSDPPVAYVAVVGAGDALPREVLERAHAVGAELAQRGAVLVCGGLGGINARADRPRRQRRLPARMEAACRGARERGGVTVGILPGDDRAVA